mmetsp:Transcript_79063/g.232128  ORF Transcript_79063/g.232128 Transcript_79063/m.232128 type:complete len:238 (+) Transcript_79063:3236-3949(+)
MELRGDVVAAAVAEGRGEDRPPMALQPPADDGRGGRGLAGARGALDEAEAPAVIQDLLHGALLGGVEVLLALDGASGRVVGGAYVLLAGRAADVCLGVWPRPLQRVPLGSGRGGLLDVRIERVGQWCARQQQPTQVRIVVELLDVVPGVFSLVHTEAPLQLVKHPVYPLVGNKVRAQVYSEEVAVPIRRGQSLIRGTEDHGATVDALHLCRDGLLGVFQVNATANSAQKHRPPMLDV